MEPFPGLREDAKLLYQAVMPIPNAEHAVVSSEKLRDYLLNPSHRRGGTKAKLLIAYGYRRENWQQLEYDLRRQHLPQYAAAESENDYGRQFEIVGPITTPNGRQVVFCSVWQIDHGTSVPRFITTFPRWSPCLSNYLATQS
jgi:hypothetical protein